MPSQAQSKTKEPRMRDSCEACAKSKLKCSRDKPICKRCQDRSLSCYYCPSQRAGRTSSTAAAAAAAAATVYKRPRSPLTPTSAKSLSPEPQNTVPNKRSSPTSYYGPFDFFDPSISSGEINTDLMYLPPQEDMDFDFAMGAPLNFSTSMMEHFDLNYTFSDRSSTMQSSLSNLSNSEDSASIFDSFTATPFPKRSPPSVFSTKILDTNPGLEEKLPELVQSHSCFVTAMSILTLQSAAVPTLCIRSRSGAQDSDLPTINSVIAKNRSAIESINTMLACPCSLDRQLGTVIFLVAFKVIAWYAAVARAPSQTSNCNPIDSTQDDCGLMACSERVLQVPTTVGRYHIDGADSARMCAQLVLSELHRVQRLVELLSKRLESARERSDDTASINSTDMCEETISAPIFVQLEADLRRRLLAVSRETMEILRKG